MDNNIKIEGNELINKVGKVDENKKYIIPDVEIGKIREFFEKLKSVKGTIYQLTNILGVIYVLTNF